MSDTETTEFDTVVEQLTPSDFESGSAKLKEKECCIILFYAPWCGHCTQFKPVYAEFAKKFVSFRVAALDCDKYKDHIDSVNKEGLISIQGYPTVHFYKKGVPEKEYTQGRTVDKLTAFGMGMCNTKCGCSTN